MVIKFADTPNQKQVRLQKQKTWKAANLFHQPKTDISLASYHPHNISYELEMLQELPKLSFSLDWEDPVFKASDSASQCWVDFAQLSQSHTLVELTCTKEEILKEENYRNYAVSNCVSMDHWILVIEYMHSHLQFPGNNLCGRDVSKVFHVRQNQ